jgi:hypothetical protein
LERRVLRQRKSEPGRWEFAGRLGPQAVPPIAVLSDKWTGNGIGTSSLTGMENRFLALIVSSLVVLVTALALATPRLNEFRQPEQSLLISTLRK